MFAYEIPEVPPDAVVTSSTIQPCAPPRLRLRRLAATVARQWGEELVSGAEAGTKHVAAEAARLAGAAWFLTLEAAWTLLVHALDKVH